MAGAGRAATLAVGAAVLIAACGSSSDSAPTSGPADSPAATNPTPATAAVPSTSTDPTPATSAVPSTSTDPAPSAAPLTTVPPTTVDRAAPGPGCRRLTDFDDDLGDWAIVNDGVMGGRSAGFLDIDASVMRFDGTIVTAGGGFTSVRRRLDDGELAATSRIELRIRPDDRSYALILESDERIDGRSVSYRAELDEGEGDVDVDDDGFLAVSASYDELETSIFGFRVEAAAFDPEQGREIGIIISDGVDGDFALDVDSIDVCP